MRQSFAHSTEERGRFMLPSEPIEGPGWWVTIVASAMTLMGGGGIGALWKIRNDKNQGVAAHEINEDEARTAHWETLLRSQVQLLVEPLERQVGALTTEVAGLRAQVEASATREQESRRKYWRAVSHIRLLTSWISHHMPEGTPSPPIPSAELAEDI